MKALYIVRVGSVAAEVSQWIEAAASEWFPGPVFQLPAVQVPSAAFDEKRNQYHSVEFMKLLAQIAPPDAERIVGVTNVDLAIPMLSFVFGQAQLDGLVAVLSLARLRQQFYGLPEDATLLRERIVKETLHELGHTFGLTHCPDSKCAMSLSTHIAMVDAKTEAYCTHCGMQVVEKFSVNTGGV